MDLIKGHELKGFNNRDFAKLEKTKRDLVTLENAYETNVDPIFGAKMYFAIDTLKTREKELKDKLKPKLIHI